MKLVLDLIGKGESSVFNWLRMVWIPVPDRVEDRLFALREVVPYLPACKPYGLEAGRESGVTTFYEFKILPLIYLSP